MVLEGLKRRPIILTAILILGEFKSQETVDGQQKHANENRIEMEAKVDKGRQHAKVESKKCEADRVAEPAINNAQDAEALDTEGSCLH